MAGNVQPYYADLAGIYMQAKNNRERQQPGMPGQTDAPQDGPLAQLLQLQLQQPNLGQQTAPQSPWQLQQPNVLMR